MKATDVMTRQVISVAPDAPILQAIQSMLDNKISGLPVVDASGKLVGIVTEGDFLRRAETGTERRRPRWLEFLLGPGRLADEYTHTHGRTVAEVMTRDPRTVAEDTPLEQAVQLMEKHRIKRLPVMRGDQVVGIVSRANLLHALAALARVAPPPAKDDAEIRTRILADLEQQKWAPLLSINVVVRDGIVELWGVLRDERQRAAMKVLAENVAGVKRIEDHLVSYDPIAGIAIDERGSVYEGVED